MTVASRHSRARLLFCAIIATCLLGTYLLGVGAAADDVHANTPDAAADEVVKKASDAKALAALATSENPDPWRVADALLTMGKSKEALAFARAAPRKAVEALAKYIEGAPAESKLAADRKALEQGQKQCAETRHQQALAKLDGHPVVERTVVAVLIHQLRGRALEQLRKPKWEESAAAYAKAAEVARDIGWLAGESTALYRAGLSLWEFKDYKGMLPFYERRLVVETALGSKAGMGRAHRGLAAIHGALRQDVDAWNRHREKAAQLAKEAGDTHYAAKALNAEAHRLAASGDYERARDKYKEVIKLLEEISANDLPARFQPDPAAVLESKVRARLMCATCAAMFGEIDEARAHGKMAVADAGGLKGPLQTHARAHMNFLDGRWHENRGENTKALAALVKARRRYEKIGDRQKHAEVLRTVGTIQRSMNNYTDAAEMLKVALAVLEKIGVAVPIAQARMRYGEVLIDLGRLDEAQKQLETALEEARRLKLGQIEVDTLGVLARLCVVSGKPVRARRYIDETLGRHIADVGLMNHGVHLAQLAGIHWRAGDYDAAHDRYLAAEDRFRADGDVSGSATARSDRGSLLSEMGRTKEAVTLLKAVLADAQRRVGETERGLATNALANAYTRAGDHAAAIPVRKDALGLFVAAKSWQNAFKARVQLGRDLFFAGRRDDALDELEIASDEADDLGHPVLQAWVGLAMSEWSLFQGKHAETIEHARGALDAIASFGLGLDDGEGAGRRSELASLSWMGAAAAAHLGDVDKVYDFLERGRAATLLAALGGRRAVQEFAVPDAFRVKEEAARSAERFAAAAYEEVAKSDNRDERIKRRAAWRVAIDARKEVVGRIQRAARAQADLAYVDVRPLKEIRASLAPDEAFVVYAAIQDAALAIVATKESKARIVPLGASADIRSAVEELLESGDYVNEDAVGAVRKALIDSLKLSPKTKRLLISPDPGLAYVPFAVIDPVREVALVPSGTTYGMLRTMKREAGTLVLALGDPDYSAPASAGDGARGGKRGPGVLPRIPNSGIEAKAITTKGVDVRLLEANASIPRLRRELAADKKWRAVHLACHGHVDPVRAAHSWLALSGDEKGSVSYLRMADVFQLEVVSDLVVLSGCETGLGTYVEGEGLRGMTRAFMLAGAPRVIASLWKVLDEPTLELMTKFYSLWNPKKGKGISAAAALRQAQNHVRDFKGKDGKQKWKHPEFWAAWVLWGLPD